MLQVFFTSSASVSTTRNRKTQHKIQNNNQHYYHTATTVTEHEGGVLFKTKPPMFYRQNEKLPTAFSQTKPSVINNHKSRGGPTPTGEDKSAVKSGNKSQFGLNAESSSTVLRALRWKQAFCVGFKSLPCGGNEV